MQKLFYVFLFIVAITLPLNHISALSPQVRVTPDHVLQGETIFVRIDNAQIGDVKKVSFEGKPVDVFLYESIPSALIGIDLNRKVGEYALDIEFTNGQIVSQVIKVEERKKVLEPLGIPKKLGGNTKQSQLRLVNSLAKEHVFFSAISSENHLLWSNKFIFPVAVPFVTDPYGYARKTGAYLIAHKGTDFRAPEGTEILAMNKGIVRVTRASSTYGNTVVIDHGLGLMTYYLHLSKILVKENQAVEQGQVVGLSGHTGYTFGAHLHLSLQVNRVAVDPMQFMSLFAQ